MSARPYMLSNENSPAFWINGILWMPLATGVLTDNRFTLIEQRMHSGGGPPTHAHTQDEGFYMLDGTCTFNAGGQLVKAKAGTFISVPRDTPHSFTIDSDPSHVLNFYLPAGFEMILMSLASPASERTIPALDAVPLPARWIVEELSREYGQSKVLGLPFADAPDEQNMATTPSKTNLIKPYALNSAEAPAYWQNDILWIILAAGEQTGNSYSLMEQLCPKRSGPPPHTHEQDEMVYLIDGEITFLAGDQRFLAKGGAFIFIPSGTMHSFRVDSETARILNFYGPSGFEQIIIASGHPTTERTLPPAGLLTPVDRQQMGSLIERFGMHLLAIPDILRSESGH